MDEHDRDLSSIQCSINSKKESYRTVAIETLIANLVERKRSANSEVTLTASLPEQSSNAVPDFVGEAFDELIGNAIAATSGDSREVAIDVECEDEWSYVTITDNGSGFPDIEASVLETGEETSLTHGQELGVWKVRMLIKQAGGAVTVDVCDSGTTVRVQLPASPRDSS